MIYFCLQEASVSPTLTAFPWLLDCLKSVSRLDLHSGDEEIAGGTFVKAVEYPTARPSLCDFEAHRDHVDVQVCLEGKEKIFLSRESRLLSSSEWDEEGDVVFYHNPDDAEDSITMRPGSVLVIFPEDAHRCAEQAGDEIERFRKFVFKVSRRVWDREVTVGEKEEVF